MARRPRDRACRLGVPVVRSSSTPPTTPAEERVDFVAEGELPGVPTLLQPLAKRLIARQMAKLTASCLVAPSELGVEQPLRPP